MVNPLKWNVAGQTIERLNQNPFWTIYQKKICKQYE